MSDGLRYELRRHGAIMRAYFARYGTLWRESFAGATPFETFCARFALLAIHTLGLVVMIALYAGGVYGIALLFRR